MTSSSPEPEFWIEDGSDTGGDDGDWDDSGWGGGSGPPGPPGGPTPPKQPRRWLRWAAIGAGLAVIAGLIAWQSRGGSNDTNLSTDLDNTVRTSQVHTSAQQVSPTAAGTDLPVIQGTSTPAQHQVVFLPSADPQPSTTTAAPAALPGAPFELVGLQWDGRPDSVAAVVRYRSDTGVTVRTEIPGFMGSGPISVVATDDAVVIGAGGGFTYVVPDGEPASSLRGLLAYAGQILPAADPHLVWGRSFDYQGTIQLTLANPLSGQAAGATFAIPKSISDLGSDALSPDGAGGVLGETAGGIYELRSSGARLLTHGALLAAGPSGYLVYECDEVATCSTISIDRATGDRTTLPTDANPFVNLPRAVLSPDGRHAATGKSSQGHGPESFFTLIDLAASPAPAIADYAIDGSPLGTGSTSVAFSPDGAVLLAAAESSVSVIETDTGAQLGPLPIRGLAAIAVRPIG